VPEGLEYAVAKTQHQQILHGVLAEIVIDPVDLLFFKHVQNNLVELVRRSQVSPKRLLDDDAHPRTRIAWPRQPRTPQLRHDVRINLRGSGEIKQPVPA